MAVRLERAALLAPAWLPLLLGPWAPRGAAAQDLFLPADPLPGALRFRRRQQRQDRPNIVWFFTDDQDLLLGGSFPAAAPGGATPMPKTRQLLFDQGSHATRWYAHTPICSPSRSQVLTGRYFHNLKAVGPEEMHVNYTLVTQSSFPQILQERAGYATGLFGKYLNQMPSEAPPGFDAWLANDGGDYIAPSFQTKNIDGLPDGWVHFSKAPENYSTAVIGNASISWIRKIAAQGRPFMAYVAPKAAHEPFNPAPWYASHWEAAWPDHEPRTPNWNCTACRADHHGNVGTEPLLTEQAARVVTGVFKNRWRTLMSVDDLIADVVAAVDSIGLSDSTYFLYSSDHGFQLGQFNIPMDKRHVYEWDTRVHFLARGPGIKPGTDFAAPATHVDVAPTILGLAGLEAPPSMDGRSVVPFLLAGARGAGALEEVPPATRQHAVSLVGDDALGDASFAKFAAAWRSEVFIEHYFVALNPKCMQRCPPQGRYPNEDSACAELLTGSACWCFPWEAGHPQNCYNTEDDANNFIAVRRWANNADELYAEFQRGSLASAPVDFGQTNFVEHFDLSVDPWQMRNLAADPARAEERARLSARLREWLRCAGSSCP